VMGMPRCPAARHAIDAPTPTPLWPMVEANLPLRSHLGVEKYFSSGLKIQINSSPVQ
jgi:hypothetical protein